MTNKAFAIDFGTSRTKAAWRNTDGKIEALKFGELDYLPSLFYLAPGDQTLEIGFKAEKTRMDDPGGFVEQLKRRISNDKIRTANGTIKPEDILEEFFRYIRKLAMENVDEFKKNGLPHEITLTLPANADYILTGKINSSAKKAGFGKIREEYEPVAAARAWFNHSNTNSKPLVVLDCGGGTTDWACVEPWENEVRLAANYPASAMNLGGVDVDEALLQWLIKEIPDTFESLSNERLSSLKSELAVWKEQVLGDEVTETIRLKGRIIPLTEANTIQIYKDEYVKPLYDSIKNYIQTAKDEYPELDLLVVGGAANNILLKQLKNLGLPVYTWNRAREAPVIGALSLSNPYTSSQPSEAQVIENKQSIPKYTPEIQLLMDELKDITVEPHRRLVIGDELALLGDPRSGVGLDNDGIPKIDWVEIPESQFIYGGGENMEQRLYLDRYFISRFPITNIQYQAFIETGGYTTNWEGLKKPAPIVGKWMQANRPRNFINWYEAVAFTRWLSIKLGFEIRLPTEQEWEKAARGINGRKYPWGNKYIKGDANFHEGGFFTPYSGYTGRKKDGYSLEQTTAVGVYLNNISPYGVMDMLGNINEWCLDKPTAQNTTEPAGDKTLVLRGGSWNDSLDKARCNARIEKGQISRNETIGFRVACSLPLPP